MKEATVEELGLDPIVQDALRRLLLDADARSGSSPVQTIVYPEPGSDAPEAAAVDLFLVTADPVGALRGFWGHAAARVREETGVHIAVHCLAPQYLEAIRSANTAFYQDLEQNGRLLAGDTTQVP